jgi:demethylmenaquinone methyltransferase / 2-methoxy-6-polyprenyl-1,4-benzoquinol methylase
MTHARLPFPDNALVGQDKTRITNASISTPESGVKPAAGQASAFRHVGERFVTVGQIEPHPVLPAYYASRQAQDGFVRDLFDRTAAEYDRINQIMSLGSGRRYRREALHQAGLRAGARVLDVAVGTGLLAREALQICGDRGRVIGVDPSEQMLRLTARSLSIPVIQGRAEALPVGDASIDFVSMGYALRHMRDLGVALAEFFRVLRPGGTLLILEIGPPDSRLEQVLLWLYLGCVVPALCRLLRNGRHAYALMRYFWATIEACVPPRVIIETLGRVGFEMPECTRSLGTFRAYRARKPSG